MTIKTKYNIGDMVFVLFLNKIYEIEIKHILINVKSEGFNCAKTEIVYSVPELHDKVWDKKQSRFEENQLFKTKSELLNSL
jgi:predicted oxidoreductase (fatty acid repression mutant protein)